jgi:hypothetical protein
MYSMTFSDGSVQGVSVTFGVGASLAIPTVIVNHSTFTYDGTAHAASATALASGTAVSGSFSFTYNGSSAIPTDAGTYAVVATFTSGDPNYSGTIATGTLTINPASPVVTLRAGTVAYDGSAHPVTAAAYGVDGTTPVSGSFAITYNGSTNPPYAPGTYTVVATFASSDPNNDYTGLTATDTLTITPAQLVLSAPASVAPGSPFNLTVSVKDSSGLPVSGFGGLVTLASTAGADITPTNVLVLNGTVTIPVTLSAVGDQIISATYPGLPAASATILVTSGGPSPFQVTFPGSSTVQAGQPFLMALQAVDSGGNPVTSYSGPATVTISAFPATAGSNLPATVPISSTGLGLFLVDLQKVGKYTFSVTSGSSIAGAGPVTVLSGPAAKLAFAMQPADTPTGGTLPPVTVQVLDSYGNLVTSDNTDTVTLAVASGPGAFAAGSTLTAPVSSGVATFSNLSLVKPGTYQLSAVDPGLFTGPLSGAFTVEPLQVLPGSFVSSPSGFSLEFNAPFLVNSLTPALYGHGFGAGAIVPAVTLTQIANAGGNPVNVPIQGSLLLETATNSITFLATNTALQANTGSPLLPDGTYLVDVADSFQALHPGGGFLDGRGTGIAGSGDFTTEFTVTAAGTDVVWAPDTADGPGQALSAPGQNQAGLGYPIYLNDTTASVTIVDVTLNYDPNLLTVTGVSGTGFTLLGSSTPGHAVLEYSGPALPTGTAKPIGFVLATVPAGTAADPTPYRAKDLLHLSDIALNSGLTPALGSDGLHVVAYAGDADGNGAYSSNDAVQITRVLLSSDSGFAAYPLVDPVIVADTDGAGFIPADAALQANEAGVGFTTANLANPPIPSGVVFQPVANNVDPSLSLVTGSDSVTVNIDDAHPAGSTGLTEAHLALAYDPRRFTVSAADVHLGSLLAGSGWSLVPTIDAVTGQIAIALSSATPITSTLGGSLVTIDLHARFGEPGASAPGGVNTPVVLVASINIGGQYVRTELEDAQGTFTLIPAPMNPLAGNIVVVGDAAAPAALRTSSIEVSASDNTPHLLTAAESRPDAVLTSENQGSADSALPENAGPVPGSAPMPHGIAALVTSAASGVAGFLDLPVSPIFQGVIALANSVAAANVSPVGQRLGDFLFVPGRGAVQDTAAPLLLQAGSMSIFESPVDDELGGIADGLLDFTPVSSRREQHDASPLQPLPGASSIDPAAVDWSFAEHSEDVEQFTSED